LMPIGVREYATPQAQSLAEVQAAYVVK
jgi:hypothetical protein